MATNRKPRTSKVALGNITLRVKTPSREDVKQSVRSSSEALNRVQKRLLKPGVRVYAKKGVPLYSVDPDEPGVFVRRLDGRVDRGVLQGGTFKVLA